MSRSSDILFEYLQTWFNFLHNNAGSFGELDMSQIDADNHDLAEGIEYFGKCIKVLVEFSKKVARGDVYAICPSEYYDLCDNIKDLQSNLQALTVEARKIADGEYPEKGKENTNIKGLGEFAKSFDEMTDMLRQREEDQKSFNKMLKVLTEHRREWIVVVDRANKDVLYCNKTDAHVIGNMMERCLAHSSSTKKESSDQCANCRINRFLRETILDNVDKGEGVFEVHNDETDRDYKINSFGQMYENRNALVFMAEDITDIKHETDLANRDAGTGFYNRRYMNTRLDKLLSGRSQQFSFVFIDIDGLKYVNDNLGHQEGDAYITYIGNKMKSAIRENDIIARIGGDEFAMILLDCPKEVAQSKMDNLYDKMLKEPSDYHRGFSFGIVEVNPDEDKYDDAEALIHDADEIMYECKKRHKGTYDDGRS